MESSVFKAKVSNGRRHMHHRIRYGSSSDSDKLYDESLDDDMELGGKIKSTFYSSQLCHH